jgi:hypothetical protein
LEGRRSADSELVFNIRPKTKDREDCWLNHFRPVWQKAGFSEWPQNAIRHTFGTYHFSLHRNENLTAAELGNAPAVVERH